MELNKNSQFEINDLLDDAVNHAIERRHEAVESLENLSDEEANNVTGGASLLPICPPTIFGYIICPPITVGIIYKPTPEIAKY